MTGPRAAVLLFVAAPDEPDAVTDAYHAISRSLAGTPGLLGNALLRQVGTSGRFVVMSQWTSLVAFRAWEEGTDHRRLTAGLRPYQDPSMGGGYGIYQVAAEYGASENDSGYGFGVPTVSEYGAAGYASAESQG